MATKDLIKKLTNSISVKPEQLKPAIKKQEDMAEVKVVTLMKQETVEERVQEEIEDIKKAEETPDRRYFEVKINRLQEQLSDLNSRLDDICSNMELLFEQHHKLVGSLEKPKSFWKRLFKWQ